MYFRSKLLICMRYPLFHVPYDPYSINSAVYPYRNMCLLALSIRRWSYLKQKQRVPTFTESNTLLTRNTSQDPRPSVIILTQGRPVIKLLLLYPYQYHFNKLGLGPGLNLVKNRLCIINAYIYLPCSIMYNKAPFNMHEKSGHSTLTLDAPVLE